jgi:hypothetical protein
MTLIQASSKYCEPSYPHGKKASNSPTKQIEERKITQLELATLAPKAKRALFEPSDLDSVTPLFKKKSHLLLCQALVTANLYSRNTETISWNLERASLPTLSVWIETRLDRSPLQLAIPRRLWNVLLYSFLGDKSSWFTRITPFMLEGSYTHWIYVPMLAAFRAFEASQWTANLLSSEIDEALSLCIPSHDTRAFYKRIVQEKKITFLPTGDSKHSRVVAIVGDLLFICDREKRPGRQERYLQASRITVSKITMKLLSDILNKSDGTSADNIQLLHVRTLQELEAREDAFCKEIHTHFQPSGQDNQNCVAASLRLAIRACYLSQAQKVDGDYQFELPLELYKKFSLFSRLYMLQLYLQRSQ